MAPVVYKSAKQAFLSGQLDLTTVTLKALAVDTGQYTFSAAHDNLDDIPSGARIGTTAALTGKTVTDGVFDADDTVFTAITGVPFEAVVIFKDTGTPSTSSLVVFTDSASSGLPFTPNGGNCNVAWDNGPSKVFAL